MSPRNRIIAIGVAVAVVVVAGFWLSALAPKRKDAAALNDQIAQAQTRTAAAETAVASAQQARSGYERDYAAVARLGKAVTADDDVASLVYQLESIARRDKVDFRAVKLTGAADGGAAATAAPAAPAAGSGTGSTSGTTGTAKTAAVTQLPPGAEVGAAGLVTLPFNFTFDGSYLDMQRFLRSIDGLATAKGDKIAVRGRLLTVDGFSLSPSRKGFPKVQADISATAYLVPDSEGLTGGATASGPGSTTTTSTTTSQGSSGASPAGSVPTAAVQGAGR